jgi:transcriptional antiterminator RfaH
MGTRNDVEDTPRVLETPGWYVVHTRPNQENRTEANLRAWGIETFNPKHRVCRENPYTSAPSYVTRTLFPSYIFARFVASAMLYKVCFTRGVNKVVSFNNTPVPVDEEIIEIIKSQMLDGVFIKLTDELKPGDQVVIEEGPFRNFMGVFDRGLKDSDRVVILLNTLAYRASIVVKKGSLKKVS